MMVIGPSTYQDPIPSSSTIPNTALTQSLSTITESYSSDSIPHTHRKFSTSPSKKRSRTDDHHGSGSAIGGEKKERCPNACNRCKAKKLKCFQTEASKPNCAGCVRAKEHCIFEAPVPKHVGGTKYVLALESRIASLESALAALDPFHPEINDHYNPSGTGMSGSNGTIAARPISTDTPESRLGGDTLDGLGGEGQHTTAGTSKLGPEQFLGENSGFAFSKVLKGAIQHRPPAKVPNDQPRPLNQMIQPDSPLPNSINPNPSLPPHQLAEEILTTLYRHLQSRYPFMDWARLRAWHDRREQICFNSQTTDDQVGAFFIWTMYAIGVEFDPREPNLDSAETYFEQAMRYLDPLLSAYDLTTIQGVLFIVFYSFRSPSGPSLWLLTGFAMRLCVELGLHRKSQTDDNPLQSESRKRVFWSAYSFDRLISLASGRPFNLSDKDIDIEPPVDVNIETTDPNLITALQVAQISKIPSPYTVTGQLTTMSSAIHSIWMFRIRSKVQSAFYTIHAPHPTREATEAFLLELEEWRKSIPKSVYDCPCQPEAKFQMTYFQTVLFTLRPAVVKASPRDPLLMLCASAAAEACELGRKVHQSPTTKHTIVSLYHIFICGMTLLHCLSVLPTVISSRVSSRAIRACSSTLAVYAQLFPSAIPFRELFEHMADEVLGGGGASTDPIQIVTNAGNAGSGGKVAAIREMLVGNYDQLAGIYQAMNGQPSKELDRSTVLPTSQQCIQNHNPNMGTNSEFLLPELATLHNLSELASFLDFPLDSTTAGEWQADWADQWGSLR
ncbi:hypothetical protein CI109_106552 [Kwoniella shandongensis]|uniref:Uncharacterized protein n=1 Tax=Kwoniella shandongensis TaxID=1734106 RepID=A0A5M6C1G7_9TREE|nr:uncharacterized protein CI109_002734 [Kwoniella shandongensis]KAA5528977.1 hypothetical protein CI109_002734 [Kwoniella shandongensis]